MSGTRKPKAFPWVTPEYCEGCADCISACPRHCLTMAETRHEGVMIPWIDDVSDCTGCGKCESACTWAAIALTSYVEEAVLRFQNRAPLKKPPALPQLP